MKKSIYTILDEKSQNIGPLFVSENDNVAERSVVSGVSRDSLAARFPADFALLRLADIDIQTGAVTPCTVPVLVKKLDELISHE